MKIKFKYQNTWIRLFGFIPIAILVYIFQLKLINDLLILDILAYILYALTMIIPMLIYYKITEKYSWYIRNGEFYVNEDKLIFNIKNKSIEIKFSDITEIFLSKDNICGSYCILLNIKWNKEQFGLFSIPLDKGFNIKETQFMDIFEIVKINCKDLDIVKDVWGESTEYWLKKM